MPCTPCDDGEGWQGGSLHRQQRGGRGGAALRHWAPAAERRRDALAVALRCAVLCCAVLRCSSPPRRAAPVAPSMLTSTTLRRSSFPAADQPPSSAFPPLRLPPRRSSSPGRGRPSPPLRTHTCRLSDQQRSRLQGDRCGGMTNAQSKGSGPCARPMALTERRCASLLLVLFVGPQAAPVKTLGWCHTAARTAA